MSAVITTSLFRFVTPEAASVVMRTGYLEPVGPFGLVWLTDFQYPLASQLQSTREQTVKLRILDSRSVTRWLDVQDQFPMSEWMEWELQPKAMPAHWFVSREGVPVEAVV